MKVEAGPNRASGRRETITVRRPYAQDFPVMLEISNWATCHTTANFRTEPETLEHWTQLAQGMPEIYPWFVAERRGAIAGFATLCPFKDRCGLKSAAEVSVYVHPDHLREGVGSALYKKLIPTATAQGFRTLVAVIAIPNPASQRLHEAFGFKRIGVLERIGWKLGRWQDLGFWQLKLVDDDSAPVQIRPASEVWRSMEGPAQAKDNQLSGASA